MADDKRRGDLSIDIEDKKDAARADEGRDTMSNNVANNPLVSIVAYCGSSILMTMTNKYVMSGVDFNLSFFLIFIQAGVCIVAIESCKRMGLITYRDFNMDEAKKWFPISLAFIGMIYTATWAIKYLSVPVFTIFKNLTIILIAYGEVLWFGATVPPLMLFSFGLIVLSSVVAAWADVQHALTAHDDSGKQSEAISTLNAGYVWMLLNCLCSAMYILSMKKRIKLTNFKDFDTMFYNNFLILPILIVCSILIEDWSTPNLLKNFPPESRNSVITAMLISGLCAVFISYASAWCVRATSSTTYSMVGALNKLPIALSGLVFFDAPITFGSVTAIFLGFVSGIVFAVAKVRQSQAPKEVLPMPASTVSASSRSAQDGFKG